MDDGWISVEDRLPPTGKQVLVYGIPDLELYAKNFGDDLERLKKEEGIYMARLVRNKGKLIDVLGIPAKPKKWVVYNTCTWYWKITHWMPLPRRPE